MSFLNSILGGGTEDKNKEDENKTNKSTNDNKDNTENNVDNSGNIWETTVKKDENSNENNNQNQNTNQNTQTTDPAEALQKHIEGLDLTAGIDLSKIQEDLQTGSTESLNSAFESIAANSYKASMMQMNKIMDQKIAAAKEQAVQESKASLDADSATREMHVKLPFTTDPNIAPVAKAALNQFLKNGKDLPTAIQLTANFFKSTAEKISGVSTPPSNLDGSFNQNSNNEQNSNNNNNSNPSDHDEWLDLLSA